MEQAFADGRADSSDREWVRAAGRSPLEELRDYPFFAPEEADRARPWLPRYGPALLAALLLVLALEVALLIALP